MKLTAEQRAARAANRRQALADRAARRVAASETIGDVLLRLQKGGAAPNPDVPVPAESWRPIKTNRLRPGHRPTEPIPQPAQLHHIDAAVRRMSNEQRTLLLEQLRAGVDVHFQSHQP